MKPRWKEEEDGYMPEMDVQDAIYEDASESPKKLNKLFIFIALGLLISAAAYLLSDIMSFGSTDVGKSLDSGSYLDGLREKIFGGNGGEAYWQRTASAFVQRGDYESAAQCYDKLTKINSSSSTAWRDMGYSLLKLGEMDKAVASLNRSTSIDPTDAGAWKAEGDALAAVGRYEEALKCYDKALVLTPRSSDVLCSMGMALNSAGRHDEAARCFEKAIESDAVPSGEAWKGRGDAMMAIGSYDEALRCYDNAVMLNLTDGDAVYKKGLALNELGRDSEADSALMAAEKIKGKDLSFPADLSTANSSKSEVKDNVSITAVSKESENSKIQAVSIASSSGHNNHQKISSSSSGSKNSGSKSSGSKMTSQSSGGASAASNSGSNSGSSSGSSSSSESSFSGHSSMVYSKVSYSEISGAS